MRGGNVAKIIFVEGETEFHLFRHLKNSGRIIAKKIVKKNFWNEDINNYAVSIPKNSLLIVVFDTDKLTQKNRFLKNICFLIKRQHTVALFQQTRNFEEEVAYCCHITTSQLISEFCKNKTSGFSDFKRDFIACSNPIIKLEAMGMKYDRWFTRELNEELRKLKGLKELRSDFMSCFCVM
ncbi:hypothetical protein AXA88_26345 [Salmonella enterica]|nr:hypothetical protein [Salmonella enterica]EAX3609345.1 hypothetical protein [Salmonella enterica]EGW6282889.1 hypothetical protein [Salmonella enterica]EGX3935265.1 hypothetical protein [Salmonella enterica]